MNETPVNPANGKAPDGALSKNRAPEREARQNPRFPAGWIQVPVYPVKVRKQ